MTNYRGLYIILILLLAIPSCGILGAESEIEKAMVMKSNTRGNNIRTRGDAVKVCDQWNSPQEMGHPVNSSDWEDAPSISPDGGLLFFTRGRDRDVYAYFSERTSSGWSEPEAIDEINLKSFPTGANHMQEGNIMYFASIRPGGQGLGDIYVSEKINGKWKNIKNLGGPVNTANMESEPFISPDQKTLYFSSNRKGGKGDTDIWMAKKTGNGWGEPVNIGGPVNSAQQETQPFVTHDGKEMYFTSMNRNGVPGPAIFKSIKQGDKWGDPTLVISGMVGEPTLTADKKRLYFVHIIRYGDTLVDAEIMYVTKK